MRFNRACAIVALVFLLITQLGKWAWYQHRGLPQLQDFAQYYLGGKMALHGQWDALYATPRPGALHNAAFADSSDWKPAYRDAALVAGIGKEADRFIQPPPAALLMAPLALLPVTWAHLAWIILLTLAAWGVALQAGQMLRICGGRATRWSCVLVLLVSASPQAHRWVRVGNLSVLMAWLTGYVTLELARGDSVGGAAALVIGAALKYAQLVLLPLHVALRRWQTLAWTAGLGIALLAISILMMGVTAYRIFLREIAPTLGRTSLDIPTNQALYRWLLVMHGITREDAMPRGVEIAFRIVQFGLLAIILILILLKPQSFWREPAHVFAAALALVAWLIIFSPIFWEHYHAYLAPFWGWLLYEAMRSRVKMILVVLGIGLAYLPSTVLLRQLHRPQLPEPFASHLLWSAVIMFGMAAWQLARGDAGIAATNDDASRIASS